jgi:membrane-bound PQQ-dependent dehydrogenase (glucose/quinate/shikimate family)
MVESSGAGSRLHWIGAALFGLIGVFLVIGGSYLASLGGSAYYVLSGIALLCVAALIARRDRLAPWLYFAFVVATFLWALAEAGWSPWELLPRIALPAGMGLWFMLPFVKNAQTRGPLLFGKKGPVLAQIVAPALALGAFAMVALSWSATRFEPLASSARQLSAVPDQPANQWLNYGNTISGDRYSPAGQITPANVAKLKVAWTYRTGNSNPPFEATPIKAGDALYTCTSSNEVISINADSGKENWRFDPAVDISKLPAKNCRGVSYYSGTGTAAFCDQRIVTATLDDRLITLDATTGKLCSDFGAKGVVDLSEGVAWTTPNHAFVTSPPLIIGDTAIVGGFVYDNQSINAPPGVVRAYDVRSGALKWAWEANSPNSRGPLAPGEHYAKATPNSWGVFSADPELGLVYLPMGNPSPDYYGGNRPPENDIYGSGIVALEAETGNVRWNFKMVHHDLWDMDVAAQPIVADLEMAGVKQKAVISVTKRGEIFVLDRATGKSLVPIIEKPVPQAGAAPGERLSPTQPYPKDFPSFGPPHLREADMWGATFLDQMLCRITFKQRRYDGPFTPPSLDGSIGYPDIFGVFNWGGGSFDPGRQILIVNANYIPYLTGLFPRKDADAAGITVWNQKPKTPPTKPMPEGWVYPQEGTPYAATSTAWTSRFGLPCNAPPWGELAAIDLRSSKVLWRQPFGTTQDVAPLGISLPTGVFSTGGSIVTKSGVMFIAASIDDYLRAYDVASGRKLWEQRLPAGGQATPMTYVSDKTGKQYIVQPAGGHGLLGTTPGDYVIAYALPDSK